MYSVWLSAEEWAEISRVAAAGHLPTFTLVWSLILEWLDHKRSASDLRPFVTTADQREMDDLRCVGVEKRAGAGGINTGSSTSERVTLNAAIRTEMLSARDFPSRMSQVACDRRLTLSLRAP